MALPGQISVGSKAGLLLINAAVAVQPAPANANDGSGYEAKGFKAYSYQVTQGVVATITFYGTLDPAAAANPTGAVAVSWSILGTLVCTATSTNFFTYSGPLVATAAKVTAWTSGAVNCWVFIAP